MAGITLHNVNELNKEVLQKGTFIILLHAASIPPHLGIIKDGFYYSIHAKGQTIKEPIKVILRAINLKKIKTLFVKINDSDNELNLIPYFEKYPSVISGKVTCLNPLRDVFKHEYKVDTSAVKFVFHLIPVLDAKNLVDRFFHLNMNNEIENENFSLKTYTLADINNRIDNLNNNEKC